jgi:diguanylate cyclase (GGDEF)-like protein/PAS domain S-box-containing protein
MKIGELAQSANTPTATEDVIKASEQRFRDLVNTTDGIVWEADARTFQFTFISEKAVKLLGFPAADWLEPGFWVSRLHPEDATWAPEFCASCTGRLEPHDFNYRFIAQDGRTVWLRDIVTVVVEQGAPRWVRGIMVDITAHKQAEIALQTSRDRLNAVLQTTIDGYWLVDLKGRIIDVNDAAAKMLGYTREALLQLGPNDIDAIDTPADVHARIERMLKSGGERFETRHRTRSGDIIDVEVSATLLPGQSALVVFVHDITQRKEAQEALKRSKDMLLETELIGKVGGWSINIDTMSATWTDEVYRIHELERSDNLAVEKAINFYTEGSRPILAKAVQRAIECGEAYDLELELVTAKGNTRAVHAIGKADLKNRRIYGFFQDLTERKQAEAALLASEERWKFAIEGAGDGLWDWNIQTGKAYYSTRYKTMLGFAEEDIGDSADEWSKRIHPDDAPGVFAAMQPYMDGKPGVATVEFRMLRKDGSWQWTMGRGMVVARDTDGKPLRMIGTNSDISGRKQAEQYERFRSHTMELLVTNEPLDDLLEAIVRGVEKLHPDMLCSILLLDDAGRHLVEGAAPSLPDFYNDAIFGIEIGLGVGSCGTAAFTGERVIVSDIATHPYWAPYKDLAARAGLGACWSQPIRGSLGQVLGTFAVYHRTAHTPAQADIDLIEQTANLTSISIERKQALAKLQLAAGVFTHALEGIMITAADATIIDVNDAFTRITGYGREEAVGHNPRFLSSGRHDRHIYEAMWAALAESGHWSGEVWNRRKDGEVFAEMLTISAVRDAQGNTQQYVALFSDITAIKEHQSQLERIAHFDALTNLPNRVLLADRLHQAMSQAVRRHQQLAVAYLDLDGFKTINDRHGHEAGDQVLITLAHRMKEALREGDTMARLGGDEFVAVLIDLEDTSASLPLLQRLLEVAALPVQLGDLSLQVSASVGVTFYPQTLDIDADQLLRQADQAMYQAKVAGKNRCCVFDAAQDRNIRHHHESLERIRLALERREFVLHYQPKVNMRSGKVIGAEALIRWQHPEKGWMAPATFLPAIEDHALAVEVGEWVIDTALHQMALWYDAGLDLPVSVNISARQLQQGDFVERLQVILAKHPKARPNCLELEVLETSALNDMNQVSQVIDECHAMGVKFALDDFGTGYSSLTYLKRLRVAVLKIDQSFVRDMLDDPDDLAILQGVIGLAAAFKREVIAEGVETVAHGTALLQLGCDLAQGYGIARPMSPDRLPIWAATWKPDAAWVTVPRLNVVGTG